MKLKIFKPTTPSQRNLVRLNRTNINKKSLLKNKIHGFKNNAGKNNKGQLVSYHRGGGNKKKYRELNFNKHVEYTGIVMSIEYDPCRSSNIAAIFDITSKKSFYILASENLTKGDIIKSGKNVEPKNGNSLPLLKIPVGSIIHNVSVQQNQRPQLSKAAGTFSQLIEKTSKFGRVVLSSGEHRLIPINCFASLGQVSNEFSFLTTLGKAGRSRWLNRRPIVRGVAMNPVDHPHGGGEGKTSGGRSSVTPWGKPTKGGSTKKTFNKLTISIKKKIKI